MKRILLATALFTLPLAGANAIQIIGFGETSSSTGITGTETSPGVSTHLAITDDPITITQIELGLTTPVGAFMQLSADSTDAAVPVGVSGILQHYSGTFEITSGIGDTGTNYLSGTFSDAAFGINGGSELSVNIASPPDTLTMTSDLGLATFPPSAFALSLSSLAPALSIDTVGGTEPGTIAPFNAFFTGDANASVPVGNASVPEPASVTILVAGLIGLGLVLRRRAG